MKIAIIGAGSMGMALGKVGADNGHEVALWSIEEPVVAEFQAEKTNRKYGCAVPVTGNISATLDMASAITGAHLVVLAVPSKVISVVASQAAALIGVGQTMLTVTKGIIEGQSQTVVTAIETASPSLAGRVSMLAGPAIAAEILAGAPTAVITGASSSADGEIIRAAFQNSTFRVAISTDVAGVAWCAILKNVYALSLGMCDGMSYSVNTKSALATWALREMAQFIEAVGGKKETVIGLAGMGDLITTGFSEHGRNRQAGELICKNNRCDVDMISGSMTAEGIGATRGAWSLAQARGLDLPFMRAIHAILFEHAEPCKAMQALISTL